MWMWIFTTHDSDDYAICLNYIYVCHCATSTWDCVGFMLPVTRLIVSFDPLSIQSTALGISPYIAGTAKCCFGTWLVSEIAIEQHEVCHGWCCWNVFYCHNTQQRIKLKIDSMVVQWLTLNVLHFFLAFTTNLPWWSYEGMLNHMKKLLNLNCRRLNLRRYDGW